MHTEADICLGAEENRFKLAEELMAEEAKLRGVPTGSGKQKKNKKKSGRKGKQQVRNASIKISTSPCKDCGAPVSVCREHLLGAYWILGSRCLL